ncbi:MAG: prolipoprotein diacylglyceryl transferase [Candidatus Peregrinibacteria bacterium]|nr:prolipoprotein diacylglyceryl transferase [Candidatus Peregrinibacteria bacterium]
MFEAFEVGPFLIWTRLVFMLLGIWLSVEFFLRLARSANLSLSDFQEHPWRYTLTFALAGRLFAILAEYRVYLKDPLQMIFITDGRFSFLGGAIGIGTVLFFATKNQRSTFLQWLDVLLPAACFGLFFGWLGSFFSGQAYGNPTDMFWGVSYELMSVRYTVPIHPVQLYYALFYFFLTFLLLVIRKKAKRVGAETLCGIFFASLATFIFESFRGDFGIPVFATRMDFVLMIILFLSLGIFAAVELKVSERAMLVYQATLLLVFTVYVFLRPHLPFATFQLRFSQLLAILAILATTVYVVIHRRKYPHL